MRVIKTRSFLNIEMKSLLNLISNLFYQLLSVGLGLLLPFLFITNLGSEANGLLSSIGQVFTCLGLLEAGIGTATVQALYKPLLSNNKKGINEILSATDIYYRKVGIWYGLLVVCLAILFPFLVDSAFTSSTIRLVILLQGSGAVFSFFIQSKYTLLLRAEGKNYVVSFLMSVLLVVRNGGKVIAIYLGYGIIAVQSVQLLAVLIEGIVISIYVKKTYPWLRLDANPDYVSISKKNAIFVQNIAWVVFNHTDILVLMIFSRNLQLISVYSVYVLVFEVGQNVINAITNSFQYKIGKYAQNNSEELDLYYSKYCIIVLVFIFAVISAIYLIGKPFIRLYTLKATDTNYIIDWLPELFFAFKILYCIRSLNKQVIEANGHFIQTRYIPFTEAIVNIITSIILVLFWDIRGVLIGTVISLILGVSLYLMYLVKITPKSIIREFRFFIVSTPFIFMVISIGRLDLFMTASWGKLIVVSLPICICCLGVFSICGWILNFSGN